MASVHPFRALRPLPDVAARVSSVPYDVVNVEQDRETQRHLRQVGLHVFARHRFDAAQSH